MTLQSTVQDAFRSHFGGRPSAIVRAPGRVNLLGEHTDYNDGFVLPAAIDFDTLVAARPRDDDQIHLLGLDGKQKETTFEVALPIAPDPTTRWSDYVRGVTQALLENGHRITGAELVIAGNVPTGAGLSSSAALSVATATALAHLNDLDLSTTELARVARNAENEYVGCQCGIMDPLASASGQRGSALLIDCRSLEVRPVPIPADLSLVIINSNIPRQLVDSAYNDRRRQCEDAAHRLGVAALRDCSLSQLENFRRSLDAQGEGEPSWIRRARHVITENQRTLDAAEALACGDRKALSTLMAASHASLRDDFEVTVPAIDILVELLAEVLEDEGGVRMTGGGFGGCVVALAPHDRVDAIRQTVIQEYGPETGHVADVFVCRATAGAGLI
jgi:galactokinase